MDYTKFANQSASYLKDSSYDLGLRSYLLALYKNMAIALLITGLVSFFVASSPSLMSLLFGTPLMWLVILAPVGMAFFLSARIMSMSTDGAKVALWVYSGLMGLSLASIFMVYTGESIARTFFVTASAFGALSIYGYTTKKDLSKMSSFFMMGLFGIVIASIVNIILQSSAISFVISAIGVVVFSFFTAYDIQRLKSLYYEVGGNSQIAEKISVLGALSLYMDFVNLFISLLQLFGQKRD